MNPEPRRKHRSLEKTDKLSLETATPTEPVAAPQATTPEESLSDTQLLKTKLSETERERDSLKWATVQLETELAARRSDFAAQKAEQLSELRVLHEVAERAHSEASLLKEGLRDARATNKALKAQNLSLQHVLNQWGVPAEANDSSAFKLAAFEEGLDRSFPKLTQGPDGHDPVPTLLRGELGSFCFPDLLHFLSNTIPRGVLTVVSDQIITKLYLERSALLYVGWNNRDSDLSLARLLEESGMVSAETLAEIVHRADFDLELATVLLGENHVPAQTIRSGLKEHARVILGFLFHLRAGSFFFQEGEVERKRELEFRLPVTDVLLKTAAEMDEKTRQLLEAR